MSLLVNKNDIRAYEDNLLKIEVHFEEFNFEHIKERQKYRVRYRHFLNYSLVLLTKI